MIRAEVHTPFFRKFLFVFLGCIAFGAYCLYDGLVAYPKKLSMSEAYEALPEDGRQDAWKDLATEKGWPTRTPANSAEEMRHKIGSQFMMAVLCGIFAIPALLKYMSGQGTWVEGDETIIRNSKGQVVPIEAISKIDKHKWAEKGIAKIHYEVDGKSKKFIMDDFKYDREKMGEIMLLAEANLDEDQVTGDDLERDKIALKELEANKLESSPNGEEA
ncbi:hypothetical protein LOC67_13625 [Stieleria sp. JC731]|uniref:hypothetical protein n=1 Tax=Pirellulaceae TaxID=2691357 RepID=UPI001E43B3C1|nr:hypothetical protein [Stieleria sp. JC731]MCC9601592.1 hypothetical protein [Stieleria sp. JC731]